MIDIEQLTKIYNVHRKEVVGVDHVSLSIQSGEIFGIIGHSGAGKSTLLRCINLLERPTSGRIIVDDTDITALSGAALREARLKIGMIFQQFCLIRSKTVFENIAFALRAAGKTKTEIETRVHELLEMVGLLDKRDAYPSQLSGGQKQRVGIARALANNPTVLLCDEATSALDPATTSSILQLLKQINRELGITIVVITHEMEVIKEICDRVAVMQNGRIVEIGRVYDLFTQPQQPLTRSFVEHVLRLDVPERLLQARTGTLVRILFQGPAAEQAILSDTLQTFRVRGNILHGKIEYINDTPLGVLLLELSGDEEEVERAIRYMAERTKGVEVIDRAA
ncbi:methionine ABC transporter ATP-binding protein [Caldibacillus thermoamylovorans]